MKKILIVLMLLLLTGCIKVEKPVYINNTKEIVRIINISTPCPKCNKINNSYVLSLIRRIDYLEEQQDKCVYDDDDLDDCRDQLEDINETLEDCEDDLEDCEEDLDNCENP